jgi:RNA polymerase sigma factor (sigma-70 family)
MSCTHALLNKPSLGNISFRRMAALEPVMAQARRAGAHPPKAAEKARPEALAQESSLRDLLVRAQAGDRAAYDVLLRRCCPIVRRMAHRFGVPSDALDDVVQEILLTIHQARHTYDPSRPLLVWISVIAHHRSVDALRRITRTRSREIYDPEAIEGAAAASDRQAEIADEEIAAIRPYIQELPAAQREAVERLALKEQSLQDVALSTGRSVGSLKVNLHRAIRALRDRMGGAR